MRVIKCLVNNLITLKKIFRRANMLLYKHMFAEYGLNFIFDPSGKYSYSNIFIGDNVSLGINPIISATRSKIIIGNNVMFGPEVNIQGGNHTTTYIGRFMRDVSDNEKNPNDDLDVIIEDDVWVGTRAIILHGVTVGRGSIVGAGSIVTKSVPPYAIVVGSPARVIRYRWDLEEIILHESKLYPKEKRLSREYIQKYQNENTTIKPLKSMI